MRKGCRIARKLRELGIRPDGVVRIDSATGVSEWLAGDPEANTRRIADTFRQACAIAEEFGERLSAEGEICWGGMHSWRRMVQLLEMVDRPQTLGFQADMAHTLLYVLGINAPEDAILPADFDWRDTAKLDAALKQITAALRPWTNDFHVAQNDATVHGTGSHDKTGRHCLPNDPNGKLNIVKVAGFWLRDDAGNLTKKCRHICWDGCMFPNATMMKPQTWQDILAAMVAVRDAHGWHENDVMSNDECLKNDEARMSESMSLTVSSRGLAGLFAQSRERTWRRDFSNCTTISRGRPTPGTAHRSLDSSCVSEAVARRSDNARRQPIRQNAMPDHVHLLAHRLPLYR